MTMGPLPVNSITTFMALSLVLSPPPGMTLNLNYPPLFGFI